MTARKFYKTVIKFEVLSEEPIPDNVDYSQILFECKEGDYSMRELGEKQTVLNGKQAARALINQGSDPEFFQLNKDGEDIE